MTTMKLEGYWVACSMGHLVKTRGHGILMKAFSGILYLRCLRSGSERFGLRYRLRILNYVETELKNQLM